MRPYVPLATTVAAALILSSGSSAQVRTVPYPEVKVNVGEPYEQDAAFRRMREALVDAATRRDTQGLLRLVGPTFMWTQSLMPADMFDLGRDASHNFKVAFGFRNFDSNADGGVEDGPFWNALAGFASESIFYEVAGIRNLVCGPLAAEIADYETFERARKTVEFGNTGAQWHFTTTKVAVAKAPGDAGPPIANLDTVAVPVLKAHPPSAPATHFHVLLPSGKTGWIPAAAMRPVVSDRLCYARTGDGDWKIVAFEKSG